MNPPNAAYEALANQYRRRLLVGLLASPPDETRVDPTEFISDDDPYHLRIAMRHVHLPKLDDEAFVEWNREVGTVSRGSNWDAIAPLVRAYDVHREELPTDETESSVVETDPTGTD